MFKPKTEKLQKLAEIYPKRVNELEDVFGKPTRIYLDFANVYHWSKKLRWHVDLKRLKQKRPLLRLLSVEQVELLNGMLRELNDRGIRYVEHRKCNFDVEMGRDMLLDYEHNEAETFVLWTGDSDFADPVTQLVKDGKRVVLFATVRRVAVELQQTDVQIFDIQKIRNFICRSGEIQPEVKKRLVESKKDS